MSKEVFKKVFYLILIAYCLLVLWDLFTQTDRFQWDFKVYYYAAEHHASGADPYEPVTIINFSGMPGKLSFVYPPLALLIFELFESFGYETSYYLYLVLKCIFLICLVLLWRFEFVNYKGGIIFYLTCIFGFGGAISTDLITGNISVFEQTLLWIGFIFLLKEKYVFFVIFVVAAALFKFWPIVFLALLVLFGKEKCLKYIIAGLVSFAAFIFLNYVLYPELFWKFLQNSAHLYEAGIINPSSFALITDISILVADKINIPLPLWIPLIVYLAAIVIILFYSGRAIIVLRKSEIEDRELIMLYFSCVVIALVMPRFKNYSFILLLVPAYYMIKNIRYNNILPFLAAAILLTVPNNYIPDMNQAIFEEIWNYFSLLLAYGLWFLYLHLIRVGINEKAD